MEQWNWKNVTMEQWNWNNGIMGHKDNGTRTIEQWKWNNGITEQWNIGRTMELGQCNNAVM